jgi:thiaminase
MPVWLLLVHTAALTCEKLITDRQEAWTAATRHQFLTELGSDSLDPETLG